MFNMFCQRIEPIARATELANTEIYLKVDAVEGLKLVIQRLTLLNGATAQTLTVMNPSAKVLTSAAADADQKVINITEDPGSIAEDDYCIVKLSDGSYQMNKVDSVSTLEITFVDDWEADIDSGASVWFYGTTSDDHPQYTIDADSEVTFESDYGYFVSNNTGYPMILSVNNATNACVIEGGVALYVQG
jgi:hypothetical protein